MAVVDWRRGVRVELLLLLVLVLLVVVVVMVGVRVLVTDRLQVLPDVGFDFGICWGKKTHVSQTIFDFEFVINRANWWNLLERSHFGRDGCPSSGTGLEFLLIKL